MEAIFFAEQYFNNKREKRKEKHIIHLLITL